MRRPLVWSSVFTLGLGLFAITSTIVQAQSTEKTEPQVNVEEVVITVSPGKSIGSEGITTGTLCDLKVRLHNHGSQKASSFRFGVKINGREMTVYDKMLYMEAVDPGNTGEIALSSFYSTDPGGPLPKDGKVTMEVTLKRAQWVEIKKEGGTQIWTPLGEVKGLPYSKTVTKQLKATG
jgi:hypothetical protein